MCRTLVYALWMNGFKARVVKKEYMKTKNKKVEKFSIGPKYSEISYDKSFPTMKQSQLK